MFWQTKPLAELTEVEWESLCDRCGRCCLVKLEDEDTGKIFYTDVACRHLDCTNGACAKYLDRTVEVPGCIALTPGNISTINWMPPTCAYRRLAEGKDLPAWHPLVSGTQESVHDAGVSVRGKTIPEDEVDADDLEDRIVSWPQRKPRGVPLDSTK